MLSRHDIDTLPENPEDALIALAELLDAYVAEQEQNREGISHEAALRGAHDVQAVLGVMNLEQKFPALVNPAPKGQGADFWEWFWEFRRSLRRYRTAALMIRRKSPMSVTLDDSHRGKIRALLERIRGIVPKLKVSTAKHEKIFGLISKLEDEVHRPRTRMEAFFALILEGSSVAKQVGEDAKPLIEDIERITKTFSDAKDEDLSPPSLPPPERKPRLEDKRQVKDDDDDDIPF